MKNNIKTLTAFNINIESLEASLNLLRKFGYEFTDIQIVVNDVQDEIYFRPCLNSSIQKPTPLPLTEDLINKLI